MFWLLLPREKANATDSFDLKGGPSQTHWRVDGSLPRPVSKPFGHLFSVWLPAGDVIKYLFKSWLFIAGCWLALLCVRWLGLLSRWSPSGRGGRGESRLARPSNPETGFGSWFLKYTFVLLPISQGPCPLISVIDRV